MDNEIVIGLADESCQHVNVNSSRLWFIRKTRVKKNTSRGEKVNSLGFYALNGKSVYLDTDSHKQDDVVSFLYKIRRENPDGNIVLVWDNARVHWSRKVRITAEQLGIKLVYLPPYSPDLNPIEFIWKSIKREISVLCLKCKEELKRVVEELFYSFSSSLSFARKWIEKFLKPLQISVG